MTSFLNYHFEIPKRRYVSTAVKTSELLNGLFITPNGPQVNAFIIRSLSGYPVMIVTGRSGLIFRICLNISAPSMIGIFKSRNTISKYVSILELKNKIYKRKVGAYNLYFSTKKRFFPKEIILSYYKALLSGLKKSYPYDAKIFKEIGRNSLEFIDFTFGPTLKKGLKSLRNIPVPKMYFEAFDKFYPSYDIL